MGPHTPNGESEIVVDPPAGVTSEFPELESEFDDLRLTRQGTPIPAFSSVRMHAGYAAVGIREIAKHAIAAAEGRRSGGDLVPLRQAVAVFGQRPSIFDD